MLSKEELQRLKNSNREKYLNTYNEGFEAAVDLLWPEIERLRLYEIAGLEVMLKELEQIVAELERKLSVAKVLMQNLDQYFCERIIDPCGYVPEAEAKEDLAITVRNNSDDNEIMLSKLRAALKEIEGSHASK